MLNLVDDPPPAAAPSGIEKNVATLIMRKARVDFDVARSLARDIISMVRLAAAADR